MTLILDLLGPPRLLGARTRCELHSGSVTVGRSSEAGWTIPDVDRLISRLHLRIDASGDGYVLTDVSANGVFLNDADVPVGYGASARLVDGDRIRIGEARIVVAVEADVASGSFERASLEGARSPSVAPASQAPDLSDGPFGSAEGGSTASHPQPTTARPSTTAIDANWMVEAQPAQRERGARPDAFERVVAPRAEHLASPPNTPAGALSQPSSLLDLVENSRDMTVHRLAEAVDEAGRTIDYAVWQAFLDRIGRLVPQGQQRPDDRTLANDRIVG